MHAAVCYRVINPETILILVCVVTHFKGWEKLLVSLSANGNVNCPV